MFSERLLTIYEKMAAGGAVGVGRGLLCSVAAEVTGSDAASIVLVADDAAMRPFCASDDFARSLVDLEMTVGEGPHHLAHANDAMVNVSDLEKVRTTDWMLYLPSSLALGARAVVGVPVRIGVIRFGVLCLFRREPGEMSEDQLTDAFLMASVVGRGIVALQAGAKPESLSEEFLNEASFDFTVHQAAGMVAVQASTSLASALIALRMYAFSASQTLADVSARVVARQLRFVVGGQEWIEEGR